MLRREPSHVLRVTVRWALLSAALGALLLAAAGRADIRGLRTYLLTFSGLLLVTMLGARPDLVEERFHPAEAHLDGGARLASGLAVSRDVDSGRPRRRKASRFR